MPNSSMDIQAQVDETQFLNPVKKPAKARKWREIEALKARNKLTKELQEIDPSFDLSTADFF